MAARARKDEEAEKSAGEASRPSARAEEGSPAPAWIDGLDEIVPGLGLHLGGVLGLLRAHVGDVVDLELDARVLGEALADLGQLLVGRRSEVVPAKVRDLPLLPACGRHTGRENPGQPCAGGGEKLSAVHRIHEVRPPRR